MLEPPGYGRHYRHHRHGRYGRARMWPPGGIFIAILLFFLFAHSLAITGALPLLVLSGIFFAFSQGRGPRGLLVPAGILLGLGAGIAASVPLGYLSGALAGAAVVAGLGAGFWLIYFVDRLRDPLSVGFEWARIPGTILLAVAAIPAAVGIGHVTWRITWGLLAWSPVLLIVAGLWLFFTNLRRHPRY
jgi:hypothetical protein